MFGDFLKSAVKALKTPGLKDSLGEFHQALILHLMFLDAKHGDGRLIEDFDISFREAARKYITFLQSLDVQIDLPAKPVTLEDMHKPNP